MQQSSFKRKSRYRESSKTSCGIYTQSHRHVHGYTRTRDIGRREQTRMLREIYKDFFFLLFLRCFFLLFLKRVSNLSRVIRSETKHRKCKTGRTNPESFMDYSCSEALVSQLLILFFVCLHVFSHNSYSATSNHEKKVQ